MPVPNLIKICHGLSPATIGFHKFLKLNHKPQRIAILFYFYQEVFCFIYRIRYTTK